MKLFSALKKWSFIVTAAAAFAAPVAALPSKGAVDLVSHRAVYDMTLDETRPASGVSGVQGRMVFEFAGSNCDGYTMNMRLVTQVEGDGNSIVTDLRSSTWEQGAGERYRFNSSHYRDDRLETTTRGDAERKGGTGDVKVHVASPSKKEIALTGPVLFPTQHSLAIIDAAKRGETILQARVYDGSSKGDEVFMTTAFIGKKIAPDESSSPQAQFKNGKALAGLDSWPVAISYFETDGDGSETPVYQLSFRLYSNGISRELLIDYGDFAIKGDLSALELIPSSKCE